MYRRPCLRVWLQLSSPMWVALATTKQRQQRRPRRWHQVNVKKCEWSSRNGSQKSFESARWHCRMCSRTGRSSVSISRWVCPKTTVPFLRVLMLQPFFVQVCSSMRPLGCASGGKGGFENDKWDGAELYGCPSPSKVPCVAVPSGGELLEWMGYEPFGHSYTIE